MKKDRTIATTTRAAIIAVIRMQNIFIGGHTAGASCRYPRRSTDRPGYYRTIGDVFSDVLCYYNFIIVERSVKEWEPFHPAC